MKKADELTKRLNSLLKDEIATRLIKIRELNVKGFIGGIGEEKFREGLAKIGGCSEANVKIIKMGTTNLKMGWARVRCSWEVTFELARERIISIGWTRVSIQRWQKKDRYSVTLNTDTRVRTVHPKKIKEKYAIDALE